MKFDVDVRISLDPALEHKLESMLSHIINLQEKTMAVIDDFIASSQAFQADLSADVSVIKTNQDAQTAQIADLQAQLANAGLTPAQTDALNALSATNATIQGQVDALAGKAATPPVVPVSLRGPTKGSPSGGAYG